MKAISMMKAVLVSAVALGFTTSCGAGKNPGENIAISLTPTSAIIVPGVGTSCTDKIEATDASVQPNRISFRNFRLEWASADSLTVAMIRVTLKHPSVSGGNYSATITDKELDYLLGTTGGLVPGATSGFKREINSSDATRGGGLAACGLSVGSIEVVENAAPFTAQAEVALVGYAETTDGVQYAVRQSTRVTVEYY